MSTTIVIIIFLVGIYVSHCEISKQLEHDRKQARDQREYDKQQALEEKAYELRYQISTKVIHISLIWDIRVKLAMSETENGKERFFKESAPIRSELLTLLFLSKDMEIDGNPVIAEEPRKKMAAILSVHPLDHEKLYEVHNELLKSYDKKLVSDIVAFQNCVDEKYNNECIEVKDGHHQKVLKEPHNQKAIDCVENNKYSGANEDNIKEKCVDKAAGECRIEFIEACLTEALLNNN